MNTMVNMPQKNLAFMYIALHWLALGTLLLLLLYMLSEIQCTFTLGLIRKASKIIGKRELLHISMPLIHLTKLSQDSTQLTLSLES